MGYLSGDGAVPVLVEEGEGLLELGNLLFVELVSHRISINLKYDNATLLLTDFYTINHFRILEGVVTARPD